MKLSKVIDERNNIPNSLQGMLGMIYRYEGATQSELAEIYKRDSKNIIKYVTDLEKRGYIEKRKDGNKKRIYLTAQGREINEHFMISRGRLIEHLMSEIPEEDLEITRKILFKIADLMNVYND